MGRILAQVYLTNSGVPVPNALCSAEDTAGRFLYRNTSLSGTAVFNVPTGTYTVRCNCTPSYVLPSRARYTVFMCGGNCQSFNFPCTLTGGDAGDFVVNNAENQAVLISNTGITGEG